MNIKAVIQYNGKHFFGYAIQPKKRTIEEEIKKAILKILSQDVNIFVAGRTDAGVHSLGNVINFNINKKDINLFRLRWSLNSVLPNDLLIKQLKEVDNSFNARYSAKSRSYVYYIVNRRYPSIFHKDFSYHYSKRLDIGLMAKAAKYLKGVHDFKSFCSSNVNSKEFIREIKRINIAQSNDFYDVDKKDLIKIEIEASAFLYNMVRIIVGTLIDVGLKKISPVEMKSILDSRQRASARQTAAACGLTLDKVKY